MVAIETGKAAQVERCWRRARDVFHPDKAPHGQHDGNLARLSQIGEVCPSALILAVEGETFVVGGACAYAGTVSYLAVDRSHWGAGVGEAVLGAAERELRRQGWRQITLHVAEWNAHARALYERSAWFRVGAPWVSSEGETTVSYTKWLGA